MKTEPPSPLSYSPSPGSSKENDCPPAKKIRMDVEEILERIKSLDTQSQFELWRRMLKTHPFDLDQLRTLKTAIDDRIRFDIISNVPYEIALYIMSFLTPEDLCNAAQTCRSWRVVCEDNRLWREKCREEGIMSDEQALTTLFKGRITNRRRIHQNFAMKTSQASADLSEWKTAYLKHMDILRNWKTRMFEKKEPFIVSPPQSSGQQARQRPRQTARRTGQPPPQPLRAISSRPIPLPPPPQPSQSLPPIPQPSQSQSLASFPRPSQSLATFPPPSQSLATFPPPLQSLPSLLPQLQLLLPPPSQSAPIQRISQSPYNQMVLALDRDPFRGFEALKSLAKREPLQQQPPELPTPEESRSPSCDQEARHPLMQLRCHEDSVITCLQYNPRTNTVVSGSDDQTLKVWSSETGKCIATLEGHSGGVWSSQLSPDDIVISGATDRTLKIWRAHTGELLHTLYGHSSTVRCLALNGDRVVSGSRDTTLRLWDIKKGECIFVLNGHSMAVRCVEFKGDIIVSGAYDHLVMVWDATTACCLHSLECHQGRIYSLQFDGKTITSGSLDTTICVWDAESGKLRHQLEGHTSLTSKMQLKDNILVSANADSYCKVWDVNTGKCLRTLGGDNMHNSAITSVYFDSRHVVTSSDDGTVKLWDLNSGAFIRNLITLPTADNGGVVWRIRASYSKLICAVGSRTQTEDTHLLVLDFE